MIDKSVIDPNALQFYRILKGAGFSAYFVGGSVRDLLLGKSPKDFDIATNATPQQIKRIIPQGRIIGRRFRHVMLEKQGGRYEIVTFRGPVVQAEEEQTELDDEAIEDQPTPEAGDARGDRGPGPRKNFPDLNQFGNAEQDAKRRDFTINALFYDPDADELVDYVEGKLDIDRKLIRTIGEAAARMEEDPIRILRAIRHKMKLGLDYDFSLEAAMREKAPLLEQTSKDRIREEFLKVCNDHSLGAFLTEGRRIGLAPHIMPWFEGVNEDAWLKGTRLWEQLKSFPIPERPSPDLGLAMMMVPLIEPLVLEPYKLTLKESEKNYLPDMKYFLSCEPLRNFYLRNLRISRAQTDHIVRTLFYYSRMSGLWLEQGPPRRIVGRLFQHPPALLAAKMAKILLDLEGKETPPWIQELADYDAGKRRGRRDERDDEPRRDRGREDRPQPREDRAEADQDQGGEAHAGASEETDAPPPRRREREEREHAPRMNRLAPPDQPMVWNGPLHAPVLRPNFSEEPAIRWARKNQTVRAYRPSGIPNPPTDHALLKSDLVYNYKPEIDPNARRSPEEASEGRSEPVSGENDRARRRGRGRGRTGGRETRGGRDQERKPEGNNGVGDEIATTEAAPSEPDSLDQGSAPRERGPTPRGNRGPSTERDEDSLGNVLRPGESPAALAELDDNAYEDEDSLEDDIGNRLDAPPTSGHVGINGEGVLVAANGRGPSRNGQGRTGSGGPSGGSGPGSGEGGTGGGAGRRRGRRRGRRGGGGSGGGQNRGSGSGSSHRPSQI